jgi:SsrA-binding protein
MATDDGFHQRSFAASFALRARLSISYISCRIERSLVNRFANDFALQQIMSSNKDVATNREAYHNYHILETHECGIALTGTEVKSIREGRCNLKDSYGLIRNGEAWLFNAHISPYSHGNRENHDPTRTRKLLLHRSEIDRLAGKAQEKGLTLVPTKMYFKNGHIKVELAVGKGKKLYDKRETEKRREADREARAIMKQRSKG